MNPRLSALEALLFAVGSDGLQTKEIALVLDCSVEEVKELCLALRSELEQHGAGIMVQEVAGTWQLTTRPEHAHYLKKMAQAPMQTNLSAAALEVLAIIAYRQPITRLEIDEVRGVQSDRSVATLIHRQLIREVGRQDAPGRPILFGTTDQFLRHFGLKSLSELPPLPTDIQQEDLSLFTLPTQSPRD